jgi:hypothetical protein
MDQRCPFVRRVPPDKSLQLGYFEMTLGWVLNRLTWTGFLELTRDLLQVDEDAKINY